MTDSKDKDPSVPPGSPKQDPEPETGGSKGKSPAKKSTTKAPKTRDIYARLGDPQRLGAETVNRVLDYLDTLEDSAPLLATLLREWMAGRSPQAMTKKLSEFGYGARLFERLCRVVGCPDLAPLWDHLNTEGPPAVFEALQSSVPKSRDQLEEFLRGRKGLPFSVLVYRAFRNDENAMGRVLRDWIGGIGVACETRKSSNLVETEKTAEWLMELAARKLKPSEFLKRTAPVGTALRSGKAAVEQADRLANQLRNARIELEESEAEKASLMAQNYEDARRSEMLTSEIEALRESIASLRESINFNQAHAVESLGQATGALKEKLRSAVIHRIEDARLFLDRPEPNVEAVMNLLAEIEEQFE